MKPLEKLNIAVVTHEATTGAPHGLKDYLIPKAKHLLFVAHPLFYIPSTRKNKSYVEEFLSGKMIKKREAFHFKGPEFLLYIKDSLYTFFWILFRSSQYDYYIGCGNINAFLGLILKRLGKVKKVIFYCIDYVPNRFKNPILNKFYHWVDRVSFNGSDFTWNLTDRMIEAREERGLRREPKHLVIPHGAHINRIKRFPFKEINKTEIVYLGTLLEKQGIQYVIEALPAVIQQIQDVSFSIIGMGPFEENLKKLVQDLKLQDRVHFLGYIPDHQEVENRLSKASLSVALYDNRERNFSYYADPGKIKNYLGAGLPLLITDVPAIAKDIEREKCGEIVPLEKDKISEAIIRILKSHTTLEEYRNRAIQFATQFDWENVFTEAFQLSPLK